MLTISRLVWDDWNIGHIARHNVSPEEVEEVCEHEPMVHQTYSGRLRLVGLTDAGRMLTVILAPNKSDDEFYVVTARSASDRERFIYRGEVEARDRDAA